MISIFVSVPRSVIGLSASNSARERMMRVEHSRGKPRERDKERESSGVLSWRPIEQDKGHTVMKG